MGTFLDVLHELKKFLLLLLLFFSNYFLFVSEFVSVVFFFPVDLLIIKANLFETCIEFL